MLAAADNAPSILYVAYTCTIANNNSELAAGLANGDIDIATVASNVAMNLYNNTEGGVQSIAAGTLGVLHILEGDGNSSINTLADLAGKTIYAAGQGENPEYVLRYLLKESGLVNVDESSELVAALGITPRVAIAKKAIPQCHLTFISGGDMVEAMSAYYSVLYSIDPASVGGALPENSVYWIGE